MAAGLAKDAPEDRLGFVAVPEGAGWANEARAGALARVRAMGLPGRRDEYWKYTRPDSLNSATPIPAAKFENDEVPIFDAIDRLKLVFVDGVFSEEMSDPIEGTGIEITRLSIATQSDIHWARDVYGKLEENGQNPVARPFAALNTATATDGLVLRATAKVEKPVALFYIHED